MEEAKFQSLMVHEREGEVVQGEIKNLHKDSMVCLKSIFYYYSGLANREQRVEGEG